jgi:hypothetical protein
MNQNNVKKNQHTPLPMGWVESVMHEKTRTLEEVAYFAGPNAGRVIRAVNCHGELLRLVKELSEIPTIEETPGIAKGVFSEMDELICEAREAIAKAEGNTKGA